MTLTELYYYYGNHPAAKAGNTRAFSFSPTTEKAASTTAVISACGLRRNRETARQSELTEHTFFPFSAHLFCAPPEFAADELVKALEVALRRVTVLPADASPPLVDLARRALAALTRIRTAGRLVSISDHVARDFRLRSDELQSRSREQRIAFARQLAMFLCRKI